MDSSPIDLAGRLKCLIGNYMAIEIPAATQIDSNPNIAFDDCV